jgi:hypothetical protein
VSRVGRLSDPRQIVARAMYKTPPRTSSAPSPIRNILASHVSHADSKPRSLDSFRCYNCLAFGVSDRTRRPRRCSKPQMPVALHGRAKVAVMASHEQQDTRSHLGRAHHGREDARPPFAISGPHRSGWPRRPRDSSPSTKTANWSRSATRSIAITRSRHGQSNWRTVNR